MFFFSSHPLIDIQFHIHTQKEFWFLYCQVMFFLGYRKEFYKECMVQVDKNVKEFKKTKAS